MTKFIITDKNIPYSNSYNHVFKFKDLRERDQYINNNLFFEQSNNYRVRLQFAKEGEIVKKDGLFLEMVISSETEIFNKNYLITQEGDNISFYFINKIKEGSKFIDKEGRVKEIVYKLELELDIFMNYFEIFDNIENFKVKKGHLPNKYYYGTKFKSREKHLKNIEAILKSPENSSNPDYQKTKDLLWLIVIKEKEEINMMIPKGNLQESKIELPYDVWISPINQFNINTTFSVQKLHFEEKNKLEENNVTHYRTIDLNSRTYFNIIYFDHKGNKEIYSIKTTNIILGKENNFYQNNDLEFKYQFENETSLKIILPKEKSLGKFKIYQIFLSDSKTEDEYLWSSKDTLKWLISEKPTNILDVKITNIFLFDLDENSSIESASNLDYVPEGYNLPGHFILKYFDLKRIKALNTYRVNLEEKDSISALSGLNTKELLIENKFKMNVPDYLRREKFEFSHYTIPLPNEWEERVMIKGINNLEEQLIDQNNKFNNNGGLFYASPIQNQYKGNLSIITELQKLNTLITNSNMNSSNQPINSGNEFYNYFLNNFGINWILAEYQFLDRKHDNTINLLKKEGLYPDQAIFVKNYRVIKRPVFNFVQTEKFQEANLTLELSNSIRKKFVEVFNSGLTIWNNYQDFMNYEKENSYSDVFNKLKDRFIQNNDRYIFTGQEKSFTILDQNFNELTSKIEEINFITAQILSSTGFIINAGTEGKWKILNQRGFLIKNGQAKNEVNILTSTLTKENLVFFGQHLGNWTMVDQKGKEVASGVLPSKNHIISASLLKNGNIFLGHPYGNWTIITDQGELIKTGYLNNSNQGNELSAGIFVALLMKNGNIFLGQDNGNWTIVDQNIEEKNSGILSNLRKIISAVNLDDEKIFVGQSFGNWTIINYQGEFEIKDKLSEEFNINSIINLNNGNIFLGQDFGRWALLLENGEIIETGILKNKKTIWSLLLLDKEYGV